MKLILNTAHMFFLCLFFTVNVYGQKITKEVIQTFSLDETIQSVKIESEKDSSYTLNVWEGEVIWIRCTIEAEGINIESVDSYKAKYDKQSRVATLQLNTGQEVVYKKGVKIEVKVTYEIFFPDNLDVIKH